MPMIYAPKGRAREYAELALNIYRRGKCFGCTYCFVRKMPGYLGDTLPDAPRTGLLDAVKKEAPKHRGQTVHLCFTCDPFPTAIDTTPTIDAIQALLDAGCNVSILTKSGKPTTTIALRHFEQYSDRIRYGATLTFDNDLDSRRWEPGADIPTARIDALRIAKQMGFSTWASFEPVINPAQTLRLIGMTASCVDVRKIGRWNHDPRAEKIDWPKFARESRALCERLGVRYVLKQDLARLL